MHVPDGTWLDRCCAAVPPLARRLAETFWPGPLTMILPWAACVPDETTGGLDTEWGPLSGSSYYPGDYRRGGYAHRRPQRQYFGRPSCTTAVDVLEDMDG